jgi:hypothetical protein
MLLRINGSLKFFQNDIAVKKLRPGHYTVTNFRGDYSVFGGRSAGGYHTEWYLSGPEVNGHIRCTSLIEACKIIDNI